MSVSRTDQHFSDEIVNGCPSGYRIKCLQLCNHQPVIRMKQVLEILVFINVWFDMHAPNVICTVRGLVRVTWLSHAAGTLLDLDLIPQIVQADTSL